MKNIPITNANHVIGPPKGWDPQVHGECIGIHALVEEDELMGRSFTTVWQFNDDEIRKIIDGGSLQLTIFVPQHPVVQMGILHDGTVTQVES